MTQLIIAGIQYNIHAHHRVINRLQSAWDSCWFLEQQQQSQRTQKLIESIDTQSSLLPLHQNNSMIKQTWDLYLKDCNSQHQFSSARLSLFPSERIDYQRNDLQLHLCHQTRQAWAVIDEHLGSIEACIQIILQYALRQNDSLLMHASAAYAYNETWLMPGISGTGKSTAARLGGFELVLADELIAITPVKSVEDTHSYLAWGTPFWSHWSHDDTQWTQHTLGLPLDLIVFLKQSLHLHTKSCHQADAIRNLLACVINYEQSTQAHAYLFELVCQFTTTIPSTNLYFPKQQWRHLL